MLKLTELPETSNVYDDQGNLIATFHADQNRVPVTFAQVPTSFVNAVVDTEDAKFWVHHGVNVWADPEAAQRLLDARGLRLEKRRRTTIRCR